ncbi:MAG: HPr-rel-A system PqqD family peptide chaperone [Arenicella sp.]|nr:HPr-rel-A system PqqD family peptide chaperone [Arenicella sp.]
MNNDKIYIQADGCLLEQMDEDCLLFNPQTAATLHLNPASALVWRLCDGKRTAAQLIAELAEQFPGQAEQIPADVAAALEQLQRLGVIKQKD